MGAVEDQVDPTALLRQQPLQFLVHGREVVFREVTARQAGLVSGHGHLPTGPVQPGDGRQATGQRLPLRGAAYVVIGIDIDDAVAVQHDQFHALAQHRDVGDAEEQATQVSEQRIAIGADTLVLGVHQHLVEEGINRRAQTGQALQGCAIGDGLRPGRGIPLGLGDGGGQGAFGVGLEQGGIGLGL